MRAIECNVCGEPLSAANDEELLAQLKRHLENEHESIGYDEEQAREMISSQAYEASDN